jgi:hypothetical protein
MVFEEVYQVCDWNDPLNKNAPVNNKLTKGKDDDLRQQINQPCPSRTYVTGFETFPKADSPNTLTAGAGYQVALMNIERVIDIIYTIEILFCFVKRTMAHKDIKSISMNYLSFYFWFDAIGTIPNLFFLNEGI